MKKYLALGLESSEPEERRKPERVRADEDAERMQELAETERELRRLSMAAERAAGRIRAMDWKEYQAMVVGLAHAASALGQVAMRAGEEQAAWVRSMAMGDLEALRKVLWVLGREDGPEHRAH